MTLERLEDLKRSLEDTLKNVNSILESKRPCNVLTQFDEGHYTDGYEHKDITSVDSTIDEDGDLLINFYSEKVGE